MIDRPIIMSRSMVCAILREVREPGTGKTETRRLAWVENKPKPRRASIAQRIAAGHVLWIKETWRLGKPSDGKKPSAILQPLIAKGKGVTVLYEAGGWRSVGPPGRHEPVYPDDTPMPDWAGVKRVSIHMPMWASRLTLDVTAVRVEPLHAIDDAGALAEGVAPHPTKAWGYWVPGIEHPNPNFPVLSRTTPREMYAALWDVINGPGSWLANPDVVVIAFTPRLCNIERRRVA